MTKETAVESSQDPSSHLVRKKIWRRRLFVVIASAILTLGACAFLGMQFGSAEQVILTLLSLSVIALVLRVFRSKGRFRFASLLLLTAFSAIVFRVVLQPLKRRSDQNAAIELVNRKGGSVSTHSGGDEYPLNANGWVQTKSGYMWPALLERLENRFLNPVEVSRLVIPSSLANKNVMESLNTGDNCKIEVLLDGADDATEFREVLDDRLYVLPDWTQDAYSPLVYVANELRENDIRFLNGVISNRKGRELPVIKLGMECRFEPKILDGLNSGFELILDGSENDPDFLKRVLKLEKLKRISLTQVSQGNISKTVLKSIVELPLISLSFSGVYLDMESQKLVCMTRCRSLQISSMMPRERLKQLGQYTSIQELEMNARYQSTEVAVIPLIKIDGLKRLELHCDADYDAAMIAAIEQSTLEDIWLDLKLNELEEIPKEPWMDRLKSLKIGRRQIVAPKSE